MKTIRPSIMNGLTATLSGLRVWRGFTIVELLIVIVIIAILAAITLVAYNGITSRSEQSKDISAAKAYIDAFNLYKVDKGEFPNTSTCLGIASTFPSGKCVAQLWDVNAPYDATVNQGITNYMSSNSQLLSYQKDTSNPKGVM